MTVISSGPMQVAADPALLAEFRADYADAFRLDTDAGHPARAWAQRCLRGADAMGGLFAGLVWHRVLGLQLAAPHTPGTLVRWQIGVDEPSRFVLDSAGGRMAGRMVFETSAAAVTWTTMLRFGRPSAGAIWKAAGHAHRALAPRCLAAAAASLARHPT